MGECLAFGWTGSLDRAAGDEPRSMLYIAPRKPCSKWGRLNTAHVAELEARGLVHPAGAAVAEPAKRDGGWTEHDRVEALEVALDLATALDPAGPRPVWGFWPSLVRRGALEILPNARCPETRARKVAASARVAAAGARAFQQSKV